MKDDRTHLWPEEPVEADGIYTVAVTIENLVVGRHRLWYRIPAQYKSYVTDSADPFVTATVFLLMMWETDLVVHGRVSPSLLSNLEEFQAAWASWYPAKYKPYDMEVDEEREDQVVMEDKAIVAFSGGVDSSFTAMRHKRGPVGKHWRRNVGSGLLVHGFDIPLENSHAFQRISKRAATTLESIDMELLTMATNYRQINPEWDQPHGAVLASCLMMLKRRFNEGLIGSSDDYRFFETGWGSNPITDQLLSSKSFRIVHDGAGFLRAEKLRAISQWPEAIKYLRSCWRAEEPDQYCGRCDRCITLVLYFRLWGLVEMPPHLPEINDRQIAALDDCGEDDVAYFAHIVEIARQNGIADSWVSALETSVRNNRCRHQLEKCHGKGWRHWLVKQAIRLQSLNDR